MVNSTLANNDNILSKDNYNLSAEQIHTVLLIFVALLAVSALGLVSGSGQSPKILFLLLLTIKKIIVFFLEANQRFLLKQTKFSLVGFYI